MFLSKQESQRLTFLLSIIRLQKHTDKYVILDKTFLEDPNLSLRLKGFLAYCLAKPDHWQFRVLQLASVLKEGRDAIRAIIDEGIEYGYIDAVQNKGADGKFLSYDYVVREVPIKKMLPQTGFPEAENAAPEKSTQASNDCSKERKKCLPKEKKIAKIEDIPETILYKGMNGNILRITRSEIHRHFLQKGIKPDIINDAIVEFCTRKKPITDALKVLELIASDIRAPKKTTAKCGYEQLPITKIGRIRVEDL